MNAIKGVVKNRQIMVAVPAEWPEGGEVLIELVPVEPARWMREEDWPRDPEGIAALLVKIDALEPFLTPEEDARWRAALNGR